MITGKLSCAKKSRTAQDRRGAVTVEMAAVVPLLVTLILGTVDVGQNVNVAQAVSNASRQGARLAARQATANVSDVESEVVNYFVDTFPGVPQADLAAATTVTVRDSSGTAIPGGDLTIIAAGADVDVEVSLEFDAVRWLEALPMLNNRSLVASTTVRRE